MAAANAADPWRLGGGVGGGGAVWGDRVHPFKHGVAGRRGGGDGGGGGGGGEGGEGWGGGEDGEGWGRGEPLKVF